MVAPRHTIVIFHRFVASRVIAFSLVIDSIVIKCHRVETRTEKENFMYRCVHFGPGSVCLLIFIETEPQVFIVLLALFMSFLEI